MTLIGRFCLIFLVVYQSVLPGSAQSLPFPPPPTTAASAAAQFKDRATAVIEANACGREDDYLQFRTEMANGNFDSEGEDLSHILLAKIAFMLAHDLNTDPFPKTTSVLPAACIGQIFRLHPLADGQTLGQFAVSDRRVRAAGPTACAEETKETAQGLQLDANKNVTLPEGIFVQVRVSTACMVRQVNDAILAMQKTTQMGSSDLPCLGGLSTGSSGEFDVTVRELMRILYLGAPVTSRHANILAPATVDYMYKNLLAASGALGDASYSLLLDCTQPAGDQLGTPEERADRDSWFKDLAKDLGDFFDWAIFTYLTYALPGAGSLIAAPLILAASGSDPLAVAHLDIRAPETENHRLNIETSRYLTNADMIARLEAENHDVGELRDKQAGVHDWLLQRLQNITAIDFQEYNARPYTRYSLNAILNLYDFAAIHGDSKLATAAGIVLDLSEAKFAATANRGRRIVPFRRRSEDDGDDGSYLFESISKADHEVARAMLLAGQTQTIDKNLTLNVDMGRGLQNGALSEMVNGATSGYRLPAPVLATIVERRTFEQTMKHTGVERVEQSPAFTISAGGIRTGPTATILGFSKASDQGIAMPTVIIPTIAGAYVRDLFRFEGVGEHDLRTENTCVAPGFACGFHPILSTVFNACQRGEAFPGDTLTFVSSAVCFPDIPRPHFYLAARSVECSDGFCAKGLQWGLMEIVEANPPPSIVDKNNVLRPQPDPAFLRFQDERRKALRAATPDALGRGVYTTAAGLQVGFTFGDLLGGPSIFSLNGGPPSPWTTSGGVIDADGQGRATIKGSGGPVTIDFSDWANPKRMP